MPDPFEHHIAQAAHDPAANYSLLSVVVHWTGALAVIVLFFTHEGNWVPFHIALGVLLTVPLIARVIYRWSVGFPRPHNQHPSLNFLARFVMILMLVTVGVLMLTGLIMPLFEGSQYPFFGLFSWTASFGGNAFVHEWLESTHDFFGHFIIPLFLLHIAGFLKHRFIDKPRNNKRMLVPFEGGK